MRLPTGHDLFFDFPYKYLGDTLDIQGGIPR